MIGLGVMSGSSLDGLDLALVKLSPDSYECLGTASIEYPKDLKERLTEAHGFTLKDYLILKSDFSIFIADRIGAFAKWEYDYISVHGHTTHHLPHLGVSDQMICGATLSACLAKPTITDFRIGDIALGGMGTPLVPITERNLFGSYDYYLNLGGIANLTKAENWSAYDVCPCNQLGNELMKQVGKSYDHNGATATKGTLLPKLFDALSSFDYFSQSPPKAIDNNWIKDNFFPILNNSQFKLEDKLYTINKWIAHQIAVVTDKKKSVFATGGGVFNQHLIGCLKEEGLNLHIPSQEIVEFKEAILMAHLGYLRLNNQINVMSSVTGARIDSIGGAIYNVHGK